MIVGKKKLIKWFESIPKNTGKLYTVWKIYEIYQTTNKYLVCKVNFNPELLFEDSLIQLKKQLNLISFGKYRIEVFPTLSNQYTERFTTVFEIRRKKKNKQKKDFGTVFCTFTLPQNKT